MGTAGRAGVGLALLVWTIGAVGCRDPNQLRTVRAKAEIEESSLDFGAVPVGEWREATLHVRNVSNVPFRVTDAVQLDGDPCFQVALDSTSPIQPGEARAVRVRFHPLREQSFADHVRVTTDAEQASSGTVTVKGQGAPTAIGVSPAALDFQTLEVDSERTLQVSVTNPVDLPITVALTGSDASRFSVDQMTVAPHQTVTLNTTFSPHDNGRSQARLELSDCDGCTPTVVALGGKSVPSAFSFSPAPVPFADIPVHQHTESQTTMTNVTWRAVTITDLATSDFAFVPLTPLAGTTVPPGGSVQVKLRFDARAFGPWLGTMTTSYTSDKARQSQVALDARGGRPEMALAPLSIDFGTLPVGGKTAKTVRITNAGTHGDLHFLGLTAGGAWQQFSVYPPTRGAEKFPWSGGAWPNLQAPDVAIGPGTDYLDVRVAFEPEAVGDFQGTLTFHSDDPFNPDQTITLTGHATALSGSCIFEVDPSPTLDFGNVPPGTGAVLGFRFLNTGQDTCAVKNIHLSDDGGGTFFMPGGELAGGIVYAGQTFSAMIAARPTASGRFNGALEMTVSDPAHPLFHLPITVDSEPSCLTAAPNYLDFGAVRYDCAPGTRSVWVSNQCDHPITLNDAWIGTGTSDQFTFLDKPATPVPLAPGEGVQATLAYARDVFGQHYSPLFFQAAGEDAPLLVPLLAETNHEGLELEHFIQGTADQLDVLFVISNTTTMQPFQQRLAQAIPGWLARAAAAGVDLHVGVTTTGMVPRDGTCPGGAEGGEAGRLFPVDGSAPRLYTPALPDEAADLAQDVQVGTCHDLVQGLEAMQAALTSPLVDHADDPRTLAPNDGNLGLMRQTARLAVVVLADEDDHSGFGTDAYVELLRALKGPGMGHRVSLSALVPTDGGGCVTAGPPGPRFAAVADQTGGQVASVCGGAADYAGLLDALTQQAAGLQRAFRLTQVPEDVASIQVTVDGTAAPEGSWQFDPDTNSVVFETAPQPGQDIAVRYRAACANH